MDLANGRQTTATRVAECGLTIAGRAPSVGSNARFDIGFVEGAQEVQDERGKALEGEIRLGDFRETFLAPIGLWSREQYESQWREAGRRIVALADRTAFVTSAFQFWWPMWRSERHLVVHEEMISTDGSAGHPVQPDDLYGSIRPYPGSRTADGEAVAEWFIGVGDVQAWLDQLPGVQ